MRIVIAAAVGLLTATAAQADVRTGCQGGLLSEYRLGSFEVSADVFAQAGQVVSVTVPEGLLFTVGEEVIDLTSLAGVQTFSLPAFEAVSLDLGSIDLSGVMGGLSADCRWRLGSSAWLAGISLTYAHGGVRGQDGQQVVLPDGLGTAGYEISAKITDVASVMATLGYQPTSDWLFGVGVGAEVICGEIAAQAWFGTVSVSESESGCGVAPAVAINVATTVDGFGDPVVTGSIRYAQYDPLTGNRDFGSAEADLSATTFGFSAQWSFGGRSVRRPSEGETYSPAAATASWLLVRKSS